MTVTNDDLIDLATRESIRINALLWSGKPRLAWQQYREFTDKLAEMIERMPGGLLDPNGPAPGVNTMDNVRYDPRPELGAIGSVEGARAIPAPGGPGNGAVQNLIACSRGAHAFGPLDDRGWRTCTVCGQVNIAP